MLYAVVGEKTLRHLVAEAKANEKVQSHGPHPLCRQMLPPLLRTVRLPSAAVAGAQASLNASDRLRDQLLFAVLSNCGR